MKREREGKKNVGDVKGVVVVVVGVAAVGCTYTLCTSVSFRYSIFFSLRFFFSCSQSFRCKGNVEGSIEPFSRESAFLTFRSNSSNSSSIVTPTKTVMMTMQHMLFSECLQLHLKAL